MARRPEFIAAPDALAEAFFTTRGRRAEKALVDMETIFAPREMLDFVVQVAASDHPLRDLVLKRPTVTDMQRHPRPAGFVRQAICDEVMFFTDGAPPQGKALLICFGGLGGRVGVSTCCFLQRLNAQRFDVVMLRDPDRTRFRKGAGSFAPDFLSLLRQIDLRFQPNRYKRVVSLGNSMGATAAAQYAVLAGAERAVAIGARPMSDALNLILGEPVAGAFDPICDCLKHRPLSALWVYGARQAEDQLAAEQLFARAGGQRLPVPDLTAHNVLGAYWRKGDLDWLLDALLNAALPRPRSETPAPHILRRPLRLRIQRLLQRWLHRRVSPNPSA